MKISLKTSIYLLISAALMGCEMEPDPNNPLIDKNTEERMLLCLEETYPEHDFSVVEDYEQHEDGWYAVCADEQGREFKVDHVGYNNMYHFRCYDEYLFTILQEQNFIEKAEKITEEYGYQFKYNEENNYILVTINIEKEQANIENIVKMILEVINCVDDIPKIDLGGTTTFSTGEVNYYTLSDMMGVHIDYITDKDILVGASYIIFNDRNLSQEDMQELIQEDYNKAIELLNESEEKLNEN